MKYIAAVCVSFIFTCALFTILPTAEEAGIYNDVLRLHVIAQSDSDEDQALKLKVRDRVLDLVDEKVAMCTEFDEAYATVSTILDEITAEAEACIRENEYSYRVRTELGQEEYPRRDYGNAVMPSGVYNSLRIIIGEGQGRNWWCVLFPGVCTRFASANAGEKEYVSAGFTPAEYRLVTGEGGTWKVKFRVLEILSSLFGKNG